MIEYTVTHLPATGTVEFPKFLPETWLHYVLNATSTPVLERRTISMIMLLCLCEGQGIEPPPIGVDKNGKPDFRGGGYHFSITHAGRLLAVALADCPVGLDMEPYAKWNEGRMARLSRIFSTEEQAALATAPDRHRAAVELWVRKEAILKTSGIGLAGLRHLDTSQYPAPAIEARVKDRDHVEYYISAHLSRA